MPGWLLERSKVTRSDLFCTLLRDKKWDSPHLESDYIANKTHLKESYATFSIANVCASRVPKNHARYA